MADPNPLSVISSDHGDESLCAASLEHDQEKNQPRPRAITADEVRRQNGDGDNAFYAVVDGFVVDATDFLDAHPGGLKKLLAADNPSTGATGGEFGFSFSRGRNAHFPGTGKAFKDGVRRYLAGEGGEDGWLKDGIVSFESYGQIRIVGKLAR